MNVLVGFKVAPDIDILADTDWHADENLHVDTSYAKLIWNSFDESALEIALRLSEQMEAAKRQPCLLSAITVAPQKHDPFLKTLYALGFEAAIRIESDRELRFAPHFVAQVIVNYVKTVCMQDIILLGEQSPEGNNMKTPFLIAEMLGWPCVTQVSGLEAVDENHIRTTSIAQGGEVVQSIKTPCVISIGNAACYLRVPTLKARMSLGKKEIYVFPEAQFCAEYTEEDMHLAALKCVNQHRASCHINGNTPAECADILYHKYIEKRF